jgi:PAS domain S-box-containing protein
MHTLSPDRLQRYGCAVLSVGLATTSSLALNPIVRVHYSFFLFFVAIVLAAGYGGYGPSLLAVVLSWLSADYLILGAHASASVFQSKTQITFAFFSVGLAISVLGGLLRATRERARSGSVELRRTLEALQVQREWLQITFASIADAVITTDPHGNVTFLNPVAAHLTGWSLPEAVGLPLGTVFRSVQVTSRTTDEILTAKVVGVGETSLSLEEAVLFARDCRKRSVEYKAAPIRDTHGKVKGVVIIFRDISERNRIELARKESEERFQQLADNINDVFWIHELEGPQTVYVSSAYESLWGRSCQSLYERPMSYLEAVHPDDRHIALQAHKRLESGEATADEYRIIGPHGAIRWIWDRGFPIRDESGRVVRVAGIAEDITERKLVEQALRDGEERFRTLADATPVLVWGSGTDKRCTYFNKQWLNFTGRSIKQEMGDGWAEGVHPDDLERCLETYVASFDARTPFTMEYRLRRHDGEYRWVLDNGVPKFDPSGAFSGYIGSCLDITDRRRAEVQLRESEERFRRIVETALEGIWVLDPQGRTTFANARLAEMLGISLADLLGSSVFDYMDPEDRAQSAARLEQRRQGIAEVHDFRFRRADGQELWAIVSASPYTDDQGIVVGILEMLTDITDRKSAEDELRQANRRREEFLAVLSHELRNPLAPIQTAVDLMDQRGKDGAGSSRELAIIKRQVQNLRRLVDDLLDVSRISRGKIELQKQLVELTVLAGEAVDAVRPLFVERRQGLQISIPELPIFVEADSTRLEQILSNLLLNASKFTPQGGRICLDVDLLQSEVLIRVRDTGIGIDPNLLPRVFDLFLQGERRAGLSHEGGGIGLSLAKNLVELHGGSIAAHSQGSDMGSEFVVKLPLSARVRPESEKTRESIHVEASGFLPLRRILIVDDNVQAADGLGRLMSVVFGQEVRVAYSGHSALDVAESFLPDLILLDLEMTGMDGYEVAMRLRERSECSQAYIVAVTGWGHEEDRRRSLELGFDLHLVKPVTARDLRVLLADLRPKLEEQCVPTILAELVPTTSVGSIEES